MNKIDVDIRDDRKFQDIVLLVDRDDFLLKRLNLLTKFIKSGKEKNILEDYFGLSGFVYDEISKLRKEYNYPQELFTAIQSAVLKGKVNDEDVALYQPEPFP